MSLVDTNVVSMFLHRDAEKSPTLYELDRTITVRRVAKHGHSAPYEPRRVPRLFMADPESRFAWVGRPACPRGRVDYGGTTTVLLGLEQRQKGTFRQRALRRR